MDRSMMLTKETFHGILVFVAKLNSIELPGCEPIPIIFEDRSVLAIENGLA